MKCCIQLNFNTGLGDFLVALSESLTLANILYSQYNCAIKYRLNLNQCKYITDDKDILYKYIDYKTFNNYYIDTSKEPIKTTVYEGCEHYYTLSGISPGGHWWDLFLDSDAKYLVKTHDLLSIFFQQNKTFGISNNLNKNEIKLPILTEYLHQKTLDITNIYPKYTSLYFRNLDLSNHTNLYYKNKNKIDTIIQTEQHLFISSNNRLYKDIFSYIDTKFLTYNTINNTNVEFNYHYPPVRHSIDSRYLDLLLEQTFMDMLILSKSQKIFCFTEWGRISNFLFYSWINNIELIYD
jgi:hypothetical protein